MFQALLDSTDEMLAQLEDLIQSMDEPSYRKGLTILNGASIGEHIRHSLEFFLAYLGAANQGTLCYDRRERDPRIQSDPGFALDTVAQIRAGLKEIDPDRAGEQINLDVDWLEGDGLPSTLGRELHYVQDHLLHHSALIKTGLLHGLENPAPQQIRGMEKFGVAPSTLAYQSGLRH
ncbi:MAG: hypothetical protein CMF59_19185 [Leptospiraceae bacterium]|nr:hypothetical protein [Leptospiraceae bacterium]